MRNVAFEISASQARERREQFGEELTTIRERLDDLLTWGNLDDTMRAAITQASNHAGKASAWLLLGRGPGEQP